MHCNANEEQRQVMHWCSDHFAIRYLSFYFIIFFFYFSAIFRQICDDVAAALVVPSKQMHLETVRYYYYPSTSSWFHMIFGLICFLKYFVNSAALLRGNGQPWTSWRNLEIYGWKLHAESGWTFQCLHRVQVSNNGEEREKEDGRMDFPTTRKTRFRA